MKRAIAFAVIAIVTAGLAAPATADHGPFDPDYRFADAVGDAAPRADLIGGWVRRGGTNGFTMSVNSAVRDVRDSGRYQLYLKNDPRPDHGVDHLIATLIKDPGRAPRATLVAKYAGADQWQQVKNCPIGTTWDQARNFVSLRVHLWECGFVIGSATLMKVRFAAQGAVDVAAGTSTLDRTYSDAAGDAAARADLRRLRHFKTAEHVGFVVQVADLPDHGRLVLETGTRYHGRIVVQKAAGTSPVTMLARGGPHDWSRVSCRPAARWDAAANVVVVAVKRSTAWGSECPLIWEDRAISRLYYAYLDVAGATDVLRPWR